MNARRSFLVVAVLLGVSLQSSVSASDLRTWKFMDGSQLTTELDGRPSGDVISMKFGSTRKGVRLEELQTESLIYLGKTYPDVEENIRKVMVPRVNDLMEEKKIEELQTIVNDMIFMKNSAENAISEHIERTKIALPFFERLHSAFPDFQQEMEGALSKRVLAQDSGFTLKDLQQISAKYPDTTPSVIEGIRRGLENPTVRFIGSDIEAMISGLEKIKRDYPEKLDVEVDAVMKRLIESAVYRRAFSDLMLLKRVYTSFPSLQDKVRTAARRTIEDQPRKEIEYTVFEDKFGVVYQASQVRPHEGGYITGYNHRVEPKMVPKIQNLNREMIETARTVFSIPDAEITAVIEKALEDRGRRWSWPEILEIAKSFPGARSAVIDLIKREILSSKGFDGVSPVEIGRRFPEVVEAVEQLVRDDLIDRTKVHTPDALIRHHRQKSLPHVGLRWLSRSRGGERRCGAC